MPELLPANSRAERVPSPDTPSVRAHKTDGDRIHYLDGWRAVAVSAVVAAHALAGVYGFAPESAGVHSLALMGVYVFFLISGFIITHLTLQERRATETFSQRNFIVRRCLRILPPLLLYALVVLIFEGRDGDIARDAVRALTFTCNVDLGRHCSWQFSHTWSLAFEEQFYLLFPFLILRRLNWFALAAVALYLLPLISPIFWIGRIGHLQIAMLFALGAAYAVYHNRLYARLSRTPFLIVAAAASLLVWWLSLPVSNVRTAAALFAPLAIFVIVFALPARSPVFRAILSNPILTQVGLYSYSIYLWQQFFLQPDASWYPQILSRGDTVRLATSLALTLIVSAISYHTYERFFRRISRRFRSQQHHNAASSSSTSL